MSFWPDCPKQPTPNRGVFCSDPSYWELLEADRHRRHRTDTGNHLNDYGWEPFSYTLGICTSARVFPTSAAGAPSPKPRATSR